MTTILEKFIEVFDILADKVKLGNFLELLSEEESDKLYKHPLLDYYDLLP